MDGGRRRPSADADGAGRTRTAVVGGVIAGSVACNDGLVLRLGDGAGGCKPLCVRPGTAGELARRGVLEGDLPEPRGRRVRP